MVGVTMTSIALVALSPSGPPPPLVVDGRQNVSSAYPPRLVLPPPRIITSPRAATSSPRLIPISQSPRQHYQLDSLPPQSPPVLTPINLSSLTLGNAMLLPTHPELEKAYLSSHPHERLLTIYRLLRLCPAAQLHLIGALSSQLANEHTTHQDGFPTESSLTSSVNDSDFLRSTCASGLQASIEDQAEKLAVMLPFLRPDNVEGAEVCFKFATDATHAVVSQHNAAAQLPGNRNDNLKLLLATIFVHPIFSRAQTQQAETLLEQLKQLDPPRPSSNGNPFTPSDGGASRKSSAEQHMDGIRRWAGSSDDSSSPRNGSGLSNAALPSPSSAHGDGDSLDMSGTVSGWLRSLRLHKYTDNLSHLDLSSLSQLSDSDMVALGVSAQGARRKLLLAIKCNSNLVARLQTISRDLIQNGLVLDAVDALRDVLYTYKDQLATCGVLAEFTDQFTAFVCKAFCHVTVGEPDADQFASLLRLVHDSAASACFPRRDLQLFCEWRDELDRLASRQGWDLRSMDAFDDLESVMGMHGQALGRHRRQRRSRTRRAQSDSAKVDAATLAAYNNMTAGGPAHGFPARPPHLLNHPQQTQHHPSSPHHHPSSSHHHMHHHHPSQQAIGHPFGAPSPLRHPMSAPSQPPQPMWAPHVRAPVASPIGHSLSAPGSASSTATAPLSAGSATSTLMSPLYGDMFSVNSPRFDYPAQQTGGNLMGSPRYNGDAPSFSLAPGGPRGNAFASSLPQQQQLAGLPLGMMGARPVAKHLSQPSVPILQTMQNFALEDGSENGEPQGVWKRRWEQQQQMNQQMQQHEGGLGQQMDADNTAAQDRTI